MQTTYTYFGEENFVTLSTYAGLLEKNNRKKEADSIMQRALPKGISLQLLVFGDNLNKQKKHQEAFKIFKLNYNKFPDENICAIFLKYHKLIFKIKSL